MARMGCGRGTLAAGRLRLSAHGQRCPAGGAGPPVSVVEGSLYGFLARVEHQLKSAGAAPQALRENSTATIEVTKDLVEQRTLSVSATNIPTEYELTYTVTFVVHGVDKELLAPQTLSCRRITASRKTCCSPRSTRPTSCASKWRGIWCRSRCGGSRA